MMASRQSKIPPFRSEVEEARSWDPPDTTEFLDELTPVKVNFPRPRPKVLVSIRLPKSDVALLRRIALHKGLGYGSLIRMWLKERLISELRPTR